MAAPPEPPPGNFQPFDMWHDYLELGRQLWELLEAARERRRLRRRQPDASLGERSGRDSAVTTSSSGGTPPPPPPSDGCRFCMQNGEAPATFRSHRLKTDDGRVTCPVLWSFVCPACGATGESAHTFKYCPLKHQRRQVVETGPLPRFW